MSAMLIAAPRPPGRAREGMAVAPRLRAAPGRSEAGEGVGVRGGKDLSA